jgi:hypothetical protein
VWDIYINTDALQVRFMRHKLKSFVSLPFVYFFTYKPYSNNKNQRDALFLNFILVKNSTCFKQIYCPSSGVLILYSRQLVFVILVMLTASVS